MKVGELKTELNKYNDNDEVFMGTRFEDYKVVEYLGQVFIVLDKINVEEVYEHRRNEYDKEENSYQTELDKIKEKKNKLKPKN